MSRSKPHGSTPSPDGPLGGARGTPNLWKRVITSQPKVSAGASMWALYMTGALLVVASVFLLIAALLLLVGEVGSGWPGRVGGAAGIVAALTLFLAGRWMTKAMEPRV